MTTITYIDKNNITHEKQYANNINSIDLYCRYITEITYIDNKYNLQELNLSNNMITKIKGLDNLVNLQKLILSNNMITEITGLDNLVNLHSIDLSGNKMITEIKGLNNLVNLQTLDLCYNMITDIKNIDYLVNLQELNLSNNKISEITGLDNKYNLQILKLSSNTITKIKGLDNLVNLQTLYLYKNMITEITGLDNLVNLRELDLYGNIITEITGLDNKYNLQKLYLFRNKITEIKNIYNLSNLQQLNLCDNNIIEIKGLNNLSNLQALNLSENMITEIPLTILNNINLIHFFHDIDIEIVNPIITRFLNRNTIKANKIAIYNDNQNVHNSDINKSISQSIYAILNSVDNNNFYMNDILCDPILTTETKESLVEYCACNDVHSTLNVTFAEVLQSVWCIIQKHADSIEIKRILNAEMSESICKCFTGRLSRLINTLNGFDDRVCIMISNNDAIGNIIVMTIAKNKDKNIIEQKEICKLELLSRGYTKDIIDEWIEYI